MSLAKESLKGAFWLGALKVGIKLFSVVKMIILARILTPTDFGLFGMVVIPYGLLEVASEPGVNQAIIHSHKDSKNYFSSIQVAYFIRGLFLFMLLFFLAPIFSSFYHADLTKSIKIIALAPLARGLINPAVVLFRKHLDFQKEFYFQLISSIIESLATIYFAIKIRSMLALPLGVVSGAVTATIMSYFMAKITFTNIRLKKILELYKYGKWVTLGTLLSYLNDQGDDFIVGKILGAKNLGYYQTAYKVSNLPTTQGAGLIYQVIFPVFSSIQTNFERLKRGVVKSLTLTFFFSLAFGLFIYKFAPMITTLVLGKQWLPMIPALNILIIFGVLRPLIAVGSALFDAIGQPNVAANFNLIKLLTLGVLIIPMTQKYGIIGASWAVVIAQIAVYPWFSYRLLKVFRRN